MVLQRNKKPDYLTGGFRSHKRFTFYRVFIIFFKIILVVEFDDCQIKFNDQCNFKKIQKIQKIMTVTVNNYDKMLELPAHKNCKQKSRNKDHAVQPSVNTSINNIRSCTLFFSLHELGAREKKRQMNHRRHRN